MKEVLRRKEKQSTDNPLRCGGRSKALRCPRFVRLNVWPPRTFISSLTKAQGAVL